MIFRARSTVRLGAIEDEVTVMPVRFLIALAVMNLLVSCAPAPEPNGSILIQNCEYGSAQSLGPIVNSSVFDGSPTVSADGTELLFTSARHPSAPRGQQDIFVSRRSERAAPWSTPVNAGAMINDSIGDDFSLRLSNDGKALYYASNRSGGFGEGDLYVATRASPEEAWSRAENLGPSLNTDAFEAFPTPSADGLTLFFNRSTTFDSQDSDIWVSTRARQWSAPQRVSGAINSERAEFSPALSPDGNRLYFASERSGIVELWVATRGDRTRDWGAPEKLGTEVNFPRSMTLAPFISNDERSLYFMSARQDLAAAEACTPGTCFDRLDLYVSTVNCR
jgi:Tol biopolymer transport system component